MLKLNSHSRHVLMLTGLLAVFVMGSKCSVGAQSLEIRPEQWQLSTSGDCEAWTDRRELLVLHHPWKVSVPGSAATAEHTVSIPDSWEGPFKLHFYLSDDYDASRDAVKEGRRGQINLPGHRFKELLIDGVAIWRQDVADAADISSTTRFVVDLPESVKPGSQVLIGFRMIDEVGSSDRQPADHRYIGFWDRITEDEPWKFMTHLYVGDVTLASASLSIVDPGVMPAALQARARHQAAWPIAAPTANATFPVRLAVRHSPPVPVPAALQAGLPFSKGVLLNAAHIRMSDDLGKPIPASASAMTTWPDGSIRIAAVTAILPAGCREVMLDIDAESEPPESAETGGVQMSFSKSESSSLMLSLANGENRIENLFGELTIDGERAELILETVETLEESPLHRELQAQGRVRSESTDFGQFVFRITMFSGQPYARLFFRVFNEQPRTLQVTQMSLHAPWRPGAAGRLPSNMTTRIFQSGAETWSIESGSAPAQQNQGQAPPWFHVASSSGSESVSVVVRHMAEQYPKALGFDKGELAIDLVAATESGLAYTPHEGEAKRHEIWLALWDTQTTSEERQAGVAWMAHPLGLFDPDYFCATGAFGRAAPHNAEQYPELTAWMQQAYGEAPASMFYTYGIRDWGDLPYNADEGTWRNGYYDTQQGFFSEYLMTGDDRWYTHLEALVRHIIDVDVCHTSAEHPDWIGSIHAIFGRDHSLGSPWSPMQRTKGMLNYWRLTGDRDARDAALGVADSALSAHRAIGATSVREHAGVLVCLMAAFDETGDLKYLQAARELAHDAMQHIDFRRGTYVEIHGNISYRGNVPWMVAQLLEPLFDYYQASGDVEAAVAIVAMAESVLAENRTQGVDGDVFGYSHNPHFKKTSRYHILLAPAILYARELTGDDEFLKQGRALYQQTIAEGTVNAINNCYWNTHTLLYFLNQFSKVKLDSGRDGASRAIVPK